LALLGGPSIPTVRGHFVTPLQTVALALRLFAIWLAIQALGYVVWFSWGKSSQPADYAYVIFMSAFNAVVIPALWFFPRIIAGKLLPSDEAQPQPSATADTWLAVGCTLIGLWTLAGAVPQLVFNVFDLYAESGHGDVQSWLVLRDALKVGIAVWLILGGKGVGKIFRWAQDVGVKKDL
jgi:hypothetical protein